MKTTPFPYGQVIKDIRPGSYIHVSKTPLPPLPPPKGYRELTKAPVWLKALTRRLNRAVWKVNKGILEANRQYARNKSTTQAVKSIRAALGELDLDLHGVHWPAVRAPFSNRKRGAKTVESAQFPLKPQDQGRYGGYVTIHSDLIESSKPPQLASLGLGVSIGIVYYAMSSTPSSSSSKSSSSSSSSISSIFCAVPGPSERVL